MNETTQWIYRRPKNAPFCLFALPTNASRFQNNIHPNLETCQLGSSINEQFQPLKRSTDSNHPALLELEVLQNGPSTDEFEFNSPALVDNDYSGHLLSTAFRGQFNIHYFIRSSYRGMYILPHLAAIRPGTYHILCGYAGIPSLSRTKPPTRAGRHRKKVPHHFEAAGSP